MTVSTLAAGVCLGGVAVQWVSAAMAAARCAPRARPLPASAGAPAVSVVQPLCGVDPFSEETLASAFRLDYPSYELLFCVADAADPVIALARRAMAAHPGVPSQLLIGDDRISQNPKLNNVVKGWKAVRRDWVIIVDSNVLMPRDYIQRLLARWRVDTGIVCAPPIGARPGSFAAQIECAFLNTYQARWQYAGETIGMGFAQGKTMLWRRAVLDAGGGVEALGAEIAEDAAATKLIHRAGLRAHLVDAPFQQPLGARRLADMWNRQLRWARLRRATFPLYFAPEILTSSLVTVLAAAVGAQEFGVAPATAAVFAALAWYGAEAMLAKIAGWPLGWASLPAWIARDVTLPALWTMAWAGDDFVWRGNAMTVAEDAIAEAPAP